MRFLSKQILIIVGFIILLTVVILIVGRKPEDEIIVPVVEKENNEPIDLSIERLVTEKILEQAQIPSADSRAQTAPINKVLGTQNTATEEGIRWFYELDFQKASESFQIAERQDPVAKFYLALIASYEDADNRARSFLRDLVDMNNIDPSIRLDSQEILDAYNTYALYKEVPREFLYALLGKAYINSGQATLGILKLKQATTLNRDYEDGWILLGIAYILAENYSEAEAALIRIDDNNRPELVYYRGLAQLRQGKWNDALTSFNQAISLKYQPIAEVYIQIGELYSAQNRSQEALTYYRNAIKEEPNIVEYYVKPIWLLLSQLDNPQGANELALEALRLNPGSALAHNLVGWVALERDDLTTSKRYLDAAIGMDPYLQVVYYNYARYFEKFQDSEAARAQYNKAIDLNPYSNIAILSEEALDRLRE